MLRTRCVIGVVRRHEFRDCRHKHISCKGCEHEHGPQKRWSRVLLSSPRPKQEVLYLLEVKSRPIDVQLTGPSHLLKSQRNGTVSHQSCKKPGEGGSFSNSAIANPTKLKEPASATLPFPAVFCSGGPLGPFLSSFLPFFLSSCLAPLRP